MKIIIQNIKGLVQVRKNNVRWVAGADMDKLPVIEDAFLHIEAGLINEFGKMNELEAQQADVTIDARGRYVFPSFVDSHSHIVFASSRESEFVDRIKGISYEEIARRGGGILNSAKRLQQISEDDLYKNTLPRIIEVMQSGTGGLEIKSGYGLTVEDELKMLRVARRIDQNFPLLIRTTFLGAHAIPKEYENRNKYIDLVLTEMIPRVAEEKLAYFCDVFCEEGFFTAEETDLILSTAKQYNLNGKVHANQLSNSGGVQAGVRNGAISVDHLECIGEDEIELLLKSDTMPTLLPGAAFFLGIPYAPARRMIDAGLPVALATDYNPGSAPSGKMPMVLSLACTQMKMTPNEAINAATINSAYAMEVNGMLGSITRGKIANIFITKPIPSIDYVPYAFGSDLIEAIILNGKPWDRRQN